MNGEGEEDEDDERGPLAWPGAGRAIARNATLLRAIGLVFFVCLAVVFSTGGIYLRSWSLQFSIQELKDYVLVSNQPDNACRGKLEGDWMFEAIELFRGCEARQREDFTRSDKEIFDQCMKNHEYASAKHCQRGREIRIFVFNLTNPEDVVEGLTPKITEVGRRGDSGPLVFYKDCRTFDTEFGAKEVEFSEYCYYTYKYPETEEEDLRQLIFTVNVGLLEAIGNSVDKIDYAVPVVWGTLALDVLNATTTVAEDYIRGQLLSFAWPNDFGAHFLREFSTAQDMAGFRARDNAMRLFEKVLDLNEEYCYVNGTQYDRNQCISMASTLGIFAKRYYESFQTYPIPPYGLKYKQGAGLFVRASIGDLLGYYEGYDDPLSSFMFPRKVSWNVVRSSTQVETNAAVNAGRADADNGVKNVGPLGRSSLVANTIEDLGAYSKFQGRTYVTEFDWDGCRPTSSSGAVVVPKDGPYPPQCNGGKPQEVRGSRGAQMKPRLWSLQPGVDQEPHVHLFSETLMRPLKYSSTGDVELVADGDVFLGVRGFELSTAGLRDGRMAFNCDDVYRPMAEAGVLNRGSDCDVHEGMFDLSAVSNWVPYVWSLPHFYLVKATDPMQHPRRNVVGLVTPTGPRYQNRIDVEPESGRVVHSMLKEQISVTLYHDQRNYFFTKHKPVTIPLYWKMDTKNVTIADRLLLSHFQSTFRTLHALFIVGVVFGAASLFAALLLGMLLYRANSLQTIEEKRKRIQAELSCSVPPGEEGAGEDE